MVKRQSFSGSSDWAGAPDETLLTRQQAADYLGCSKSWLANAVTYKMENIPKPDVKEGRDTKYRLSSLRAWQKANGVEPPSAPKTSRPSRARPAPEPYEDSDREDTTQIMIAGLEQMLDNLKAHRERKGNKS